MTTLNAELRTFCEARHDAITAHGARLVAVSPQISDGSLTLTEKHDLTFDVLSDIGSYTTKQCGLAFDLPHDLAAAYDKLGFDLQRVNDDHPRTLPVPATCAIGRDGVIRRAFIDTDCTTRANPPTSSPPSTPWPEATSRHRPWTGALNPPRGPHP